MESTPEYLKIPAAAARFGVSRSKLYELATLTPRLFVKLGKATLVDCGKLREVMAALPAADIRVRGRSPAAPQPARPAVT